MEHLTRPVNAPHFYRSDEATDSAWLWTEYVERHSSDPWVLDDYSFATYKLGYWNGTCIIGMHLLTEPWLARQRYRFWLSDVNFEEEWQFSLHQKHRSDDTRNQCEPL